MRKNEITSAEIKRLAHDTGFDLCGVTSPEIIPAAAERYRQWLQQGYHADMAWMAAAQERRSDPSCLMEGVRAVIMLGLNYYSPSAKTMPVGHGRVSRYARGRDYHKVIGRMIKTLLRRIETTINRDAVVMPDMARHFKWWVDYGPFLERPYAERAGLGFIGKNSMLINHSFGSWIFLAEMVTSLPLEFDQADPNDHGRCGKCRLCIDACPTGAIVEDGVIDARRCISYLTIERRSDIPAEPAAEIGDNLFGCDVCQEVCPLNQKRATLTAHRDLLPGQGVGESLDCHELLNLGSREQFLTLTAGTALTRPKLDGLKRNARIVLENQNQGS